MKQGLTELVFILDQSGSMYELKGDTIGGFNSMLEKQKQETGEAFVTTVLFDSHSRMLHDRVPVTEVPVMTEADYVPGGTTALLDAIGSTVEHISNIHKYAREEDVPAHTIFVIMTDGMENSSCRFSLSQVRSLIEQQKKEKKWKFLFLGANMDAIETARSFGISPECSVQYENDSAGIQLNYHSVSDAVSSVRMGNNLSPKWKENIEKDFQRRGKK